MQIAERTGASTVCGAGRADYGGWRWAHIVLSAAAVLALGVHTGGRLGSDLDKFVNENPDQNFYQEEELGGKNYFTAVYADKAVAGACVACQNNHPDTPRDDFKLGDVMGGGVIRLPL